MITQGCAQMRSHLKRTVQMIKKNHSFFLQSSAILLSDVSNPLIYITTRCTMKWYYYADILQLLDCTWYQVHFHTIFRICICLAMLKYTKIKKKPVEICCLCKCFRCFNCGLLTTTPTVWTICRCKRSNKKS